MNGELYDEKYPNRTSIYEDRARQAGYLLLTAFCMICSYYVLFLPARHFMALCRTRDSADKAEGSEHGRPQDTNLESKRKETYDPVSRVYDRLSREQQASRIKIYNRYPSLLFASWKHYENVHILMWLGKDTAWNWDWKVMWICFTIPTILIGLDFIHKSLFTKRLMIDHAHYCAQFLWVFSNLIWAYGELFLPEVRDGAIDFWTVTSDAKKSARWFSTWVLLSGVCVCTLCTCMYLSGCVWSKEEVVLCTTYHIPQGRALWCVIYVCACSFLYISI
jgi:hypothetical protein